MTTGRLGACSDAELVEAARGGEREAFAELVMRHRPTAVALAARLLGSVDLAGDAVQEATVVAMVSLNRLRSADRFGAWLCGIALNVGRRWLRELRTVPLPPGGGHAAVTTAPDEQVEATELAAAVRRAVAGLANGQREAVLLFYLQGLTHREVAIELGISVGAVKARLHQARAALTPKLAPLIDTEEKAMTQTSEVQWTDVSISEVRRDGGDDPTRRRHVIVLRERGGSRELAIWVGPFEATAIALNLEPTEMPRPMTYQLASNLVTAVGARVAEVRLTRMDEYVFFAVVVVTGPTGSHQVDARPSDGLNLALVTDSPIRVDQRLMQLQDPPAVSGRDWRSYPDTAADIAAEVRQRQEEAMASLARETGHVDQVAQGPSSSE